MKVLEMFDTAEVTLKVIQGHCYWCDSILHLCFHCNCLYLVPFWRYFHLFAKI